MQPLHRPNHPILQLVEIGPDDPDRPSRADRQVDQVPSRFRLGNDPGDLFGNETGIPGQVEVSPRVEPVTGHRGRGPGHGIAPGKFAEPITLAPILAPDPTGNRLEDLATADGPGRALLPDHERLTVLGDDRLTEKKLGEPLKPGLKLGTVEQRERGRHLGRPQMQAVAVPVPESPRGVGRGPDRDREHGRWSEKSGIGQLLTALDLGMVNAGQVDRRPRSALDPIHRLVMPMESPDPDGPPRREPGQLVSDRDRPGKDRPGDNRPMPGDGEATINRHPEGCIDLSIRQG